MDSVRCKISDDFTSSDPKFYGADFDSPNNHGTANVVVTDSLGNTVVATSSINTQYVHVATDSDSMNIFNICVPRLM